jgi:hypothetical protein
VLEIVRNIGDMRRLGDSRLSQPSPLVALGRGMIEFENSQILGALNPIGEGVQARAEHENLPQALGHRAASHILGEAAAHGDEEAQGPPLGLLLGQRDRFLGVLPEYAERERVGENDPVLEYLMCGPVSGRADRGAARLSLSHSTKVEARRRPVERRELDVEKPLPYRPRSHEPWPRGRRGAS